ncbi:beta-ketoacyl synthase N-terminal-like domain-containing protein [Streptomyces nogalater]
MFGKFDQARALASDGRVRPFAKGRTGLLLGDGAAVFVVESAARARSRGAEPLAAVSGWALSGDAHHVVHPHPEERAWPPRRRRRCAWPAPNPALSTTSTPTAPAPR